MTTAIEKLEAKEHAIYLMIETLRNAIENAETTIEVQVYESELRQLYKKNQSTISKRIKASS